jgi:hypothetical protein
MKRLYLIAAFVFGASIDLWAQHARAGAIGVYATSSGIEKAVLIVQSK